jgi:hypothetical protein
MQCYLGSSPPRATVEAVRNSLLIDSAGRRSPKGPRIRLADALTGEPRDKGFDFVIEAFTNPAQVAGLVTYLGNEGRHAQASDNSVLAHSGIQDGHKYAGNWAGVREVLQQLLLIDWHSLSPGEKKPAYRGQSDVPQFIY